MSYTVPAVAAIRSLMALHCVMPMEPGDIIGPYCSECVSPIDGGPEMWPCLTVKAVMDSFNWEPQA